MHPWAHVCVSGRIALSFKSVTPCVTTWLAVRIKVWSSQETHVSLHAVGSRGGRSGGWDGCYLPSQHWYTSGSFRMVHSSSHPKTSELENGEISIIWLVFKRGCFFAYDSFHLEIENHLTCNVAYTDPQKEVSSKQQSFGVYYITDCRCSVTDRFLA